MRCNAIVCEFSELFVLQARVTQRWPRLLDAGSSKTRKPAEPKEHNDFSPPSRLVPKDRVDHAGDKAQLVLLLAENVSDTDSNEGDTLYAVMTWLSR